MKLQFKKITGGDYKKNTMAIGYKHTLGTDKKINLSPFSSRRSKIMKKFLLGLLFSISLCSSSWAYQVGFDIDGLGVFAAGTDEASTTYYDQFTLAGQNLYFLDGDEAANWHDVVSDQYFVGSDLIFEEHFVLKIEEADNLSFQTKTDWNDRGFYAEIDLKGIVGGGNITYLTSGLITMYLGDAVFDLGYSGTDIKVATLGLNPAMLSTITVGQTNLGDGVEADLSLNFLFLETEFPHLKDFWNDDVDTLTNMSWLLAFVNEGDISVQEDATVDLVGKVGWSIAAVTAEFTTVPEPTTMLLFGLGLIGLAGASRKRLS